MNQLKKRTKIYSVALLLGVCYLATAQTITITGTVSDNTGELLPGVNILVRGTTAGASTSVDGAYSITVSNAQFPISDLLRR